MVRSVATGTAAKAEHQKTLMASKERERRKLDQKLKNLYEAISDETDRELRLALSEKAKETKRLLEGVETAILDLKREYGQADNVIDISGVMKFIEVFRTGAFDALPVAAQSEILKDRVRRIVVRDNGIHVEIFCEKRGSSQDLLGSSAGTNMDKEGALNTRSPGSGVRTVFKLVRPTRFELVTFGFGS